MRQVCLCVVALIMTLPASATGYFTDFEQPVPVSYVPPPIYQDYYAGTAAAVVRFSDGFQSAPIPTWTSSATYCNIYGAPVEIYFSVPVKNITFKLFGFYNDSRGRAATIEYSSLPYDPSPHNVLTPSPILYYAPTSGPALVTVPADNIRYMTVDFGGQPFAIDDFSYEAGSSYDYTLTGQILDGTAQETKHLGTTTTAYAQVPLGLELKLGLLNNGQATNGQYTLAPAAISGLANPTLYPTNVVLEYDRGTSSATKTFRAVHIGTQTLYINPGPNTPVLNVTVAVIDPGALGNDNVQYDPMIVAWGNRRGILPHVLKGLMLKETGFNPMSYRYEPLNPDTGDLYLNFKNYQLEDEPYEHYRMATAAGLAKGDLQLDLNTGATYINDDDVSPRKVLRRANGQRLTPLDVCPARCVSAKELLLANDGWVNWTDYADFDPSDPKALASIDFTAQTPLAASYGLMQEMYVVAAEFGWSTIDGRQNPSLLFDTPANVAIGGGSMAIGTREFYKRYRSCRTGDWATDPGFDSSDAFRDMIIDALNFYNHGNKPSNQSYGSDIWSFSQQYMPSHPLSKIFP